MFAEVEEETQQQSRQEANENEGPSQPRQATSDFEMPTCFAAFLGKSASACSKPSDVLSKSSKTQRASWNSGCSEGSVDDCEIIAVHSASSARSHIAPLAPDTRKRKLAVLELRKRPAAAELRKRPAAADAVESACEGPMRRIRVKTPETKNVDSVLSRPTLSWGNSGRLELCAFDEKNKKVFVFGGHEKKYGPRLESHGLRVKKFMETTKNVTKAEAIEYKNKLMKLPLTRIGEDVE
jgi:hypothetical protein